MVLAKTRLVFAGCAIAMLAMPPAFGAPAEATSPPAGDSCPPWVDYPADTHKNAESPYLGCTNALNLKNMVERPADLERGRALGPADGGREADSVLRYRRGQVKALPSDEPAAPTLVLQGGNAGGTQ